MFLFDTDHVVIIQQQTQPEFGRLIARIGQFSASDFFVSIVSFHEQVMGWNTYLSRARNAAGVVKGYRGLEQILANFAQAQVLLFDDAAADLFDDLRKQRIRIGTMDLRIAAIALSRNMTVLTRNATDFTCVPGLNVEDWTTP
jgi:tRNA(fMet)-specific endonuclease VapC